MPVCLKIRQFAALSVCVFLSGLVHLHAEDENRSFTVPENSSQISFAPTASTGTSDRQLWGIKDGFSSAPSSAALSQPITPAIAIAEEQTQNTESIRLVSHGETTEAEASEITEEKNAKRDEVLDKVLFGGDGSQEKNRLERPKFSQAVAPLITAFGSLVIVISAFFLLVLFFKKVSPKGNRVLPKEAFEDLGRTFLTQKNVLHLLRLGNRLILVSVTPDGVSPVAEIDDPDEVVTVLGMCRRLETESASQLFRKNLAELSKEDAKTGYFGTDTKAKTPSKTKTSVKEKPSASKANLDLYSEPTESLADLLASGASAKGGRRG